MRRGGGWRIYPLEVFVTPEKHLIKLINERKHDGTIRRVYVQYTQG